jgi:hypothetical protein
VKSASVCYFAAAASEGGERRPFIFLNGSGSRLTVKTRQKSCSQAPKKGVEPGIDTG